MLQQFLHLSVLLGLYTTAVWTRAQLTGTCHKLLHLWMFAERLRLCCCSLRRW